MKHIIIDKVDGMDFQQTMFMAQYAEKVLQMGVKICIPGYNRAFIFSQESVTKSSYIGISPETVAFISSPENIQYCVKNPDLVLGCLRLSDKDKNYLVGKFGVSLTNGPDGYIVEGSSWNGETANYVAPVFSYAAAEFIYRIKNKIK